MGPKHCLPSTTFRHDHEAYHALQQKATEFHSLSLAKLAVQLKTSGGAFRKILNQKLGAKWIHLAIGYPISPPVWICRE